VPFTAFYTGYRQSVARQDELIVAFHVPALAGPQWFRKVGTRAAQAISKVVFAGVAGTQVRLAVGSVAPTVVRLTKTEGALAAGRTTEDAQRVMLGEIAPIDDIRSTASYRRQVALNLLAQFCEETRVRSRRTR
jgi:CO/xanthine dehydrogenase FAD-binding subunit